MKKKHFNLAAKIVAVLYIILITMLSFDEKVFSLGFLMHLIPTIIFTGFLILAIYKPKIGGTIFAILGIITIFFFKTYNGAINFITISLIPIIIGIIFFFSSKKK